MKNNDAHFSNSELNVSKLKNLISYHGPEKSRLIALWTSKLLLKSLNNREGLERYLRPLIMPIESKVSGIGDESYKIFLTILTEVLKPDGHLNSLQKIETAITAEQNLTDLWKIRATVYSLAAALLAIGALSLMHHMQTLETFLLLATATIYLINNLIEEQFIKALSELEVNSESSLSFSAEENKCDLRYTLQGLNQELIARNNTAGLGESQRRALNHLKEATNLLQESLTPDASHELKKQTTAETTALEEKTLTNIDRVIATAGQIRELIMKANDEVSPLLLELRNFDRAVEPARSNSVNVLLKEAHAPNRKGERYH